MSLRKVAWCNLWNRAAALHTDTGSRVHLTASTGATGRTLCGRSYPADKGFPAAGSVCQRCRKSAGQSVLKDLGWVESREED